MKTKKKNNNFLTNKTYIHILLHYISYFYDNLLFLMAYNFLFYDFNQIENKKLVSIEIFSF